MQNEYKVVFRGRDPFGQRLSQIPAHDKKDPWGRTHGDEVGTSIRARRSTWFTLLATMVSFSPDKFSPKKNSLKDVQGYIHGVSDVKTPANPNSTRYFDFILQEGDEERQVVCFNANKHDEVKQQEKSKLPVQLSNMSPQKRRYGEGIEYKMSKFSRLTPAKNLPFQWKQWEQSSQGTVKEILENKSNGKVVALKAKVLSKSEVSSIHSHMMKKELSKCDIIVADGSGAIIVTLWENQIEQVFVDRSFYFQGLKVNCFNKKQLSSTKSTKIDICDDIAVSLESSGAAEELKPREKSKKSITRTVFAADVRKSFTCINCKSKISDIDEKSALKCVNCNLKSDMICSSTANLIIKNENGENAGRYYCPHSAMQDIFHKISSADGYTIDKDVSKLSAVMEDTLLNVPKLTFDVLSEEKVVKGIELCN